MAKKMLNTAQAAAKLGISASRVRVLISDGRLPAEKVGRDYIIDVADLTLVKNRPTGRPPKAKG
jgi:excisionase family DNA binding protein